MKTPYIGATDFTTREQVLQAVSYIPVSIPRRLHVGAMCSYKTINNIPTATGWENIWLNGEKLNQLFQPHPNVYNVIHYADYANLTTLPMLVEAIRRSGPHVHAIQLDMKWPEAYTLAALKAQCPSVDIIQQIGHVAISESSNWEANLAQYQYCADYVLLDAGMGKRTPFDPDRMLELVETALMYFDEDQIAVAGGLGPNTYKNLAPLFDLYPDLSCDAQGQLRASIDSREPIEIDRVCAYIDGVCSLIK